MLLLIVIFCLCEETCVLINIKQCPVLLFNEKYLQGATNNVNFTNFMTKDVKMKISQFNLLIGFLCQLFTSSYSNKNVLFIISDDMRPDLRVYHRENAPTPVGPTMHTPNLDLLASNSLLLTRAYVQFPLCTPSRSSMLTGRRPETIQVYALSDEFRDAGNFTTLPQFFKENGYFSTGIGKVFHGDDDELSW